MSRLLVVFLALLLPAQFAWASAAGYCQHETGTKAAQHFGHHEHVHQDSGHKSPAGKTFADTDCGTCHAAGAPVVAAEAMSIVPAALASETLPLVAKHRSSALPDAPYRPKWPRLA